MNTLGVGLRGEFPDRFDVGLDLFGSETAPEFLFEPIDAEQLAKLGPERLVMLQGILLNPPEHLKSVE